MHGGTSSGCGRGLFLALFLGALTACGGAGGSANDFEALDHDVGPPAPGTFLGDEEDESEPTPVVPPCVGALGPRLDITTFERAIAVIGQDTFTDTVSNSGAGMGLGLAVPDGLEWPHGVATDATSLWVADSTNNRVLKFDLPLTTNGPDASLVIGQTDLISDAWGLSVGDLCDPVDVERAGDRVIICDSGNNRVLIFTPPPTVDGDVSKVVVGQKDFISRAAATTQTGLARPSGVHVVDGKLIVVDRGNSRVLIWNEIPTTNGAPADIVVGQPDFTSNAKRLSRKGFASPVDVWSDGCRLVVSDWEYERILIWNYFPAVNYASADIVLGQLDFTSDRDPLDRPNTLGYSRDVMFGAHGIDSNGRQLFVADREGARVLIWNSFPTSIGQLPDAVLGQSDWFHNRPNDDNQDGDGSGGYDTPSDRTFFAPVWVHIQGKQLFVTDGSAVNDRILIFE